MKKFFFLSLAIGPLCLFAQTYIIKSQGGNNNSGGAYVAPVVTKTYTLPTARTGGAAYNAPSSFSFGNSYRADNTKTVKPKNSGSSELYTPIQSKADAANNFKCISGNCENGFGTFQGSPTNTYKYVGNFKNGKHHGQGTIYDWEGYILYEGGFVDGIQEGIGKKTEFAQEIVFGDGSITRYNIAVKSVYEGGMKGGRFDGKGRFIAYTDFQTLKSIYTGDFVAGKRTGDGVILNFAKDKISAYYSGGWKDNEYDGVGIDSTEKGMYIGDYIEGERSGQGTSYWSTYTTNSLVPVVQYIGMWKGDSKEGAGVEYDKKGKILFEGNFANGQREGKGKLYKEDGSFGEDVWVKGANKEAGTEGIITTVANKSFEENFKDNQNLWPHNSPYFVATVQKGVYHIECMGGYKDYNNFRIDIPGGVYVTPSDDWSIEVIGKSTNKNGIGGTFGIGWQNAEFTINPVSENADFKYEIKGFGKSKGISIDTKVKKGFNTISVVKIGNVLEAFVNGKKIFSGEAGNISSHSFALVMEKQLPDYKPVVDYKKVVFKKLN